MPSLVLGSGLAFFPGRSLQKLSLQACPERSRRAAPTHRPIAFAPEGFVVSSAERLAP